MSSNIKSNSNSNSNNMFQTTSSTNDSTTRTVLTDNDLAKTYLSQLTDYQSKINKLSNELENQTPLQKKEVESYQNQFFNKLRKTIDETSNVKLDQTRSSLSQRFGGSLNSTFGSDLLSRIEKNRLDALAGARSDTALMGQQMLFQDREQNRNRKLQVLQALQGQYSMLSSALRNTQTIKDVVSRQQTLSTPLPPEEEEQNQNQEQTQTQTQTQNQGKSNKKSVLEKIAGIAGTVAKVTGMFFGL